MNHTTKPFLTLVLIIVIVIASVVGTLLLWPDTPARKSVNTSVLFATSE